MNIRTNMPSECLTSIYDPGQGDHTYSLRNMCVLSVFSKLSQPLADNVLKANITLPLQKYIHWQQPLAQNTNVINAIYSVSKEDLIQGLWFAFHSNVQGDRCVDQSANDPSLTNR